MKPDLIVNPYTEVFFINSHNNTEEKACVLVSPQIEAGLKNLLVSSTKNPDMYELFEDLSKVRLDFLDVEKDLSDTERELLYEHGFLVETENVPTKPLFSCSLSEVENAANGEFFSALTVNPDFRFEPVNLDSFSVWIQQKHLSPYQSSVWIKTLVTEIEIGYWLDEKQAEIVSQFEAGEKLPFEIEKDLLAKLIAAEIVVSDKIIRHKEETYGQIVKEAKNDFEEKKYAVLPELLPPAQMNALRTYFREYVRNGFMPFGDLQVNRRYYQHDEPLAVFFHQHLTKVMSLVAGKEVQPSYVYAASYKEDAKLKPHVDREQCEYSFSFQVDYLPEQENHLSPWGLFVRKLADGEATTSEEFPAENQASDTNRAVYLKSGDALIYKGCELIHYRYALPPGHQSTSLFFHYVPVSFEGHLK